MVCSPLTVCRQTKLLKAASVSPTPAAGIDEVKASAVLTGTTRPHPRRAEKSLRETQRLFVKLILNAIMTSA